MNTKKIFLIASLLCYLPVISFGQNKAKELHAGGYVLQATTVDTSLNEMFVMCGEMPEFPGGIDKLLKYAQDFLYYPESAVKDSIEGRVLVQFMIDTTGKASYETIIESVRTDIDTICLSMIRHMPTWTPGKIGAEKVQVRFWWHIKFVLNSKKK
jgi:protein TonB